MWFFCAIPMAKKKGMGQLPASASPVLEMPPCALYAANTYGHRLVYDVGKVQIASMWISGHFLSIRSECISHDVSPLHHPACTLDPHASKDGDAVSPIGERFIHQHGASVSGRLG